MSLYVDEYSILETTCIIHAMPLGPCDEHDHAQPEYLIGLILSVGHQAFQTAQAYPTRQLRDAAFEKIAALVQRQAAYEQAEQDALDADDDE